MKFLERDAFLDELEAARSRAATVAGCAILVSGEAGIGKTTLVDCFARRVAQGTPRARVLWGSCDALFTPRPLGPLLDIARQADGPLHAAIAGGADREHVFAALLAELSRRTPQALAIFEDVHWADEATLDLLKFVGRRVRQTHAMVVFTFRDDEVGPEHPLRRVLGELPREDVRRMRLPPLSKAAVAQLAREAGRPEADLHAITGGNPFFLTEVLASAGGAVPPSVKDAVLARAAHLGHAARALLDVVALVPGRTESWLLEAVLAPLPDAVEECARAGVLLRTRDTISFRHELARRAWEDGVEPGRAAALHASLLRIIADHEGERTVLARLVHHGERAADSALVLRLAPAAAREAAELGAHREAAAHYETALRHSTTSVPAERASLLDAWSYEIHLAERVREAIRAREQALEIWRAVGDRRREGDALRWLSRLSWLEGRKDDAAAYAIEATAVLEPLGACHELAMAYSTRSQLHLLLEEWGPAADWGNRAVAMAEQLNDVEALVHALTNVACIDPGTQREKQVRVIRLALENGLHEHALRAYAWVICDAIEERDYATAEHLLDEALPYALDRDIDVFADYLRGWRARMRLEQGRWQESEADATAVLRRDAVWTIVRIPALAALGLLHVRRGEAAGRALLDEALERALATGELQRLAPVAAARAEASWLDGDAEGVRREVARAYQMAVNSNNRWDIAELSCWLHRAGTLEQPPPSLVGPFALEVAGDWSAAADAWQRLGCPYERALALAHGDPDAQRTALEILDALDARPAAGLVRARMRERGVAGIPRGPRQATRRHPAGLTRRQQEVLELVAQGLSNANIAAHLYLSTRTVDHHVSSILQKLGAVTRAEAVAVARRLQILG